jgi:NDP-sugar pyrophosphorylase family protein
MVQTEDEQKMKAVVLAGGIGSRLRPLTFALPKAMIPVGEKPILEHIIEYLKKNGVQEIVIATAYLGKFIEDYFEDGSKWGVTLQYARGEKPLGTAGQLRIAESFIPETFVAMNGDILTDVSIREMVTFHRQNKGIATIAVRGYNAPLRYGIINSDHKGRILSFEEKPNLAFHMNIGLYVLEPRIFQYIEPQRAISIERETFPKLIRCGEPVYAYKTEGEYFDVADLDSLQTVDREFLNRMGI